MPEEHMQPVTEIKESHFSEWGAVFLAIVVTAAIVGVIGALIISKNIKRIEQERSAKFQRQINDGASIFPDLLKETEEETTE